MPVFYEFKISVADRDDIDRSDDLEDMGIDSEPDWEDANCTIDLEKIWAFYPDSKYQTKLFFGNEKMIVHHKYEDVKEIFRKHCGVQLEK